MKKGIRIRLYPNNNQVNILNKIFGHARYVYNYFLNYSKENKIIDILIGVKYNLIKE